MEIRCAECQCVQQDCIKVDVERCIPCTRDVCCASSLDVFDVIYFASIGNIAARFLSNAVSS